MLWELPHWITWLGGVLTNAGYQSLEVVDLYSSSTSAPSIEGIDSGVVQRALHRAPADVYLFSPMIPNLHFSIQIADLVKELYPDSVTVFGGVTATPLHKEIAAHRSVDFVVRDRGERALPTLIRALHNRTDISQVKNLSFRKENGEVVTNPELYPWLLVNDIPFPKIDLFPADVGQDIRYLRQVYALGCPFKCSFCTIPTIGRKPNYFSIDRVIEEIYAYRSHYGAHHNIYFGDETFTVDRTRTMELCDALRADGTIKYDCQTRPNLHTDQRMLRSLSESGCLWIEFGIEAINQNTLDIHKQRMELDSLREVLMRVRDAGIAACSFMVNGFPNQTLDDMKYSIDTTCSLISDNLLAASYLFGLVPYPGSDLYEKPNQFGMNILHHKYELYHEDMLPVYATAHATSEQIYQVFLTGIQNLAQAMAGRSNLSAPLPPSEEDENMYGLFWNEPHI